jgi:beta-glucosidase
LFPFGHGLSYTRFEFGDLRARAGRKVTVSFKVRNTGAVKGRAVAQVYVSPSVGGWEAPQRLAGFKSVTLDPRGDAMVTLEIDPRLLATYDEGSHGWRIAPGTYDLLLGVSSRDIRARGAVRLTGRSFR